MSVTMLFKSLKAFEPWTWFASLGFFAFLRQFIPREFSDNIRRNVRLWLQSFSPYIVYDVNEYDSSSVNTLYRDVEIYLSSLTSQAAHHLNLCKPKNAKELTFTMVDDQRTRDQFDNTKVEWVHRVYLRQRPMWTGGFDSQTDEKRNFTLRIWRKDTNILQKYVSHIQARALELKRTARDLLLYTNSKGRDSRNRRWESVNFVHPATFDTLALDRDLKTKICADLDKFANGEEYYKRVGKAWKRGYLLYGPPGTGKSSMIAAIANKMRYDVYDLELTEVESNIELRKLLLHTENKSVIVIEDIDCSLDLSGQRKKKKKEKKPSNEPNPANPNPKPAKAEKIVTLSGLLNFVDGLWSCCGSERIFIFTTNYVEKLDPALLRAGRMDMHINLSYCTFSAFQVLAKNYLQITDHELLDKLRTSFEGSYMTPAEVGEVLIKNQDSPTTALEGVLSSLDEHRVKPEPPPPESDDEKEDEKVVDGLVAAAVKDKEVTATTTNDAVISATEIEEHKEEPAESSTGQKQVSQKKILPIDDPVEINGEVTTTNNATDCGDAAVTPAQTVHVNGGAAAGTKDTIASNENGDAGVRHRSNGAKSLSDSASRKDAILNGDATTCPPNITAAGSTSNGVIVRENVVGGASQNGADASAAPHSNGSACKVEKENGVSANETANGDKSAATAAVTPVN